MRIIFETSEGGGDRYLDECYIMALATALIALTGKQILEDEESELDQTTIAYKFYIETDCRIGAR
jgi:hypothetical protein